MPWPTVNKRDEAEWGLSVCLAKQPDPATQSSTMDDLQTVSLEQPFGPYVVLIGYFVISSEE